jgi:hypothetical protein
VDQWSFGRLEIFSCVTLASHLSVKMMSQSITFLVGFLGIVLCILSGYFAFTVRKETPVDPMIILRDRSFSRAKANKKMAAMFSLSNPFANDDETKRLEFRSVILARIHRLTGNAVMFERQMCQELDVAWAERSHHWVEFFCVSVMRVYLKLFCETPATELEVRALVHGIADMWTKSKTGEESMVRSSMYALIHSLESRHLADELKQITANNLFNVLLPGHDTLWRLVMFAII